MTTKINPSEISSIIKKKIDGYKGAATEANVGEVLTTAVVRTSPTFASVAAPLYPSIFFLMMLDISEGLILVVIFSPLIC